MTTAEAVISHIETHLKIPTGPLAGEPFKVLRFQRDWITGTFQPDIDVGVLCIGRGNGKTTLAAAIGHAGLVGVADDQTRREVVIVARTLEQGRTCYDYLVDLIQGLPQEEQTAYTIRKAPRLASPTCGRSTSTRTAASTWSVGSTPRASSALS